MATRSRAGADYMAESARLMREFAIADHETWE